MNTSQQVHERTRMFARVLGPFLVIADVAAVLRASDMRTLLSDFSANSAWPWVSGAFILIGGLVIVALHQYWHGPAAIIVSALGWLIVVRGMLLLFIPDSFMSLADNMIGATAWWMVAGAVMALIGVYLTYVGWAPEHHRPAAHAADANRDVTPAA
ncbi:MULTISPECIES: hypothetical protein [Mycolicibacterium]|uniref:Transmembrane protein n=1 Tax=Mycolicibacterium vanbaalenii (strain DSM 7251 / JCM 13017 / BCRC 16820 / KCTC 9966 / NRRL B-24157 / PYR-1) TaxID=350058 RepID=A1T408_MYCVP|nr:MULTISPECIES: hypothetical protein [Mycolicibacterium]ABM11908.1 conserved hypothetical protein [Mycolicibacterium vanbaalenii PYR-1]MCV7129182.1 hypothetical protein [Mycolicibacterium vanbaalenii PYR-1]MDW5611490.1 hypothetical protein [Mycolicibacterium sp. D5.8-2]QZY47211.1 hypothetical protein K5L12_05585 [Mycolicibacterium austroafricanum]UJL30956.1 hypothetical protein HZU38_11395 [Mycolicibacterium vanbaalenii]